MDVRAKQLLCYQRVFLPLACVAAVSPHVISSVGSFKGELSMRRALFIAVLILNIAPMGVGQKQRPRGSHRTSVEEAIRKLDNERIQAQIHADATALDRIYAADFIA